MVSDDDSAGDDNDGNYSVLMMFLDDIESDGNVTS